MKKQQVLVMHGGGSFIPKNKETILEIIATREVDLDRMRRKVDWKATMQQNLGDGYDVLAPKMPNSDAPKYDEWKAWFEKILPLLDEDCIFIGHSLGGMFMIKYFSEKPERTSIKALLAVAPPYGRVGYGWDTSESKDLEKNVEEVYLYHSEDDQIVSVDDFHKYVNQISPKKHVLFKDRGHFNNENFPEIINDIKSL